MEFEKIQIQNETEEELRETTDDEVKEERAFIRSNKLMRSPQLVATPTASRTADKEVGTTAKYRRTKLEEARKLIDELYEYMKPRTNVHATIKSLTVRIKAAIAGAEREQQECRARAEKAEEALQAAQKHAAHKGIASPTASLSSRNAKRKRQTPETREALKRVKDSDDTSGREDVPNDRNHRKEQAAVHTSPKAGRSAEAALKTGDANEWRLVNTRKKGKEKVQPKRRERQKADALIVEKTGQMSYAEILKKVKSDPELKDLGDKVARIRRTQKGEMLFELKKNAGVKSSAYKELIEKSVNGLAKVKALSQECIVECRNLDEITTVKELEEALSDQFDLGVIAPPVRLRKSYGGTQTASIKLPVEAANKLLDTGRIKVGWTVCSLRLLRQPVRCFKCMGFGHQAKTCTGPDRSELCRKCGKKGHEVKDCVNAPSCLLCSKESGNDHVTGGPRCPVYKKAVESKK